LNSWFSVQCCDLISERWYVAMLQRFGVFKLALNSGEAVAWCVRGWKDVGCWW
jgi:hypothetical protein